MHLRRARPADRNAVLAVHRAAFARPDGDDVVGHVICTRGRLG
jgi:hypothetical protein